MELILVTVVMVILGMLAVTANELGVDSRDMSDDPHRPDYPVTIT